MSFICYVLSLLIYCHACWGCEHDAAENQLRRVERNVFIQYSQKNNTGGYILKEWMEEKIHLGGVNGITIDDDGLIYVFHRHDRVWNSYTFNLNNEFMQADLGPISSDTILIFHSNGSLVNSRGNGMFYMPHGISVDKHKNVWITDVALHQVMKLPPNSDIPLLTLGKAFKPGQDTVHFCKPTSVAVLRETDDFFVADGYCNYRILKFNSKGVKILEWGRSSAVEAALGHIPGPYEYFIPHALTIVENQGLICVADRQNGRVLCYLSSNNTFVSELSNPAEIGSFIYSVAYSPYKGGQMFLINGKTRNLPVQAYSLSLDNKINSRFGAGYLQYPHDIAVSPDASAVYVAELNPPRVAKFVLEIDNNKTKADDSTVLQVTKVENSNDSVKLTGAVLVITTCFIFAGAIILATFMYTRNKKTGCGRCRNNFWMLKNGGGEGFKLGNILGHEGFQQLNQGAESDEEHVLA